MVKETIIDPYVGIRPICSNNRRTSKVRSLSLWFLRRIYCCMYLLFTRQFFLDRKIFIKSFLPLIWQSYKIYDWIFFSLIVDKVTMIYVSRKVYKNKLKVSLETFIYNSCDSEFSTSEVLLLYRTFPISGHYGRCK